VNNKEREKMEETQVLEINLISAQGLKEPTEFLSSETSGVSIEIYAVGYLRDHLIGTVRFLVSNFLPTAAVKVPSLVALQIRRPSGKFHGVLNIAAMVMDASELPADFFKSVQEIRRSRKMRKSRSAVSSSENGSADDGESSKENSVCGSVNFSDDGTDSTASSPMPSPLRDWNAVRNLAGKNHVRSSSDGGGLMCCFLMKSSGMLPPRRKMTDG
jgi:hypothetical protein